MSQPLPFVPPTPRPPRREGIVGLRDLKEAVAALAQARRQLADARHYLLGAQLKEVVTPTHLEKVETAERDLALVVECFLVTWGGVLERLDAADRTLAKVEPSFCASCGKRDVAGFCARCEAEAAALVASGRADE